jgi:hypothetical protein
MQEVGKFRYFRVEAERLVSCGLWTCVADKQARLKGEIPATQLAAAGAGGIGYPKTYSDFA